jgi:hypothetical protein
MQGDAKPNSGSRPNDGAGDVVLEQTPEVNNTGVKHPAGLNLRSRRALDLYHKLGALGTFA